MRIRPKSLSFTILLGALAALPPLSIDMGLPAFPSISASLRASSGEVGLTLSLFMLGFAIAQLLFGPLSDRYGRKPVLIVGCGLFALAGAACAAAPSISTLIAWRLVQGAGAGAGMVLTLAIVRDLFDGAIARAQLSYVNLALERCTDDCTHNWQQGAGDRRLAGNLWNVGSGRVFACAVCYSGTG